MPTNMADNRGVQYVETYFPTWFQIRSLSNESSTLVPNSSTISPAATPGHSTGNVSSGVTTRPLTEAKEMPVLLAAARQLIYSLKPDFTSLLPLLGNTSTHTGLRNGPHIEMEVRLGIQRTDPVQGVVPQTYISPELFNVLLKRLREYSQWAEVSHTHIRDVIDSQHRVVREESPLTSAPSQPVQTSVSAIRKRTLFTLDVGHAATGLMARLAIKMEEPVSLDALLPTDHVQLRREKNRYSFSTRFYRFDLSECTTQTLNCQRDQVDARESVGVIGDSSSRYEVEVEYIGSPHDLTERDKLLSHASRLLYTLSDLVLTRVVAQDFVWEILRKSLYSS